MDHNQFDGLTRALNATTPRRVLAGGGFAALFASAFTTLEVDAKKKGKKRR